MASIFALDVIDVAIIVFIGIPLLMIVIGFGIILKYGAEIYSNGKDMIGYAAEQLPKFLKSPEHYRKR